MKDLLIKIFFVVYSLFCILTCTHYICIAGGTGTTGTDFLKINPGANSGSMGNAGVALPLNTESIYLNPAAVAKTERKHNIGFTHIFWWKNINYEYVAYLNNIKEIGTFGCSLNYLYMPKLKRTDYLGNPTGEKLKIADLAGVLTYAREICNGFSLGSNLKYINRKLGPDSATAFAADVGVLYQMCFGETESREQQKELRATMIKSEKKLNFGVAVQNIGTKIKFKEEEDELPLIIKMGTAFIPFPGLYFVLDADKPKDEEVKLHGGIAYWPVKIFGIRAGYEGTDDLGSLSGITAGLSFKIPEKESSYLDEYFSETPSHFIKSSQLDYAFRSFGDLGYAHYITLKMGF